MTQPISDEDLAALWALAAQATNAPWEANSDRIGDYLVVHNTAAVCDLLDGSLAAQQDALLIAAARNALPGLRARIAAEAAELARLRRIEAAARDLARAWDDIDTARTPADTSRAYHDETAARIEVLNALWALEEGKR